MVLSGCGFAAVDSLVVEECSPFRDRAYSAMRHLQDGSVSVYPLPLNASENPHIEELPRAFDRPPGRQFFSQSNSSRSDEFNKALRIRDLSMTVLADATGGRLLGKKSLPEAVRAAGADARNGLRLTFSLPQTASDRAVHTIDLTIRGKSNRLMFPHYLYVSQPDGETDDVSGSRTFALFEIQLS